MREIYHLPVLKDAHFGTFSNNVEFMRFGGVAPMESRSGIPGLRIAKSDRQRGATAAIESVPVGGGVGAIRCIDLA